MPSYVGAVTDFVAAYPHLAYGIVFLAALLEAVPIAGIIVPGSLIIVAVSALVPTGALALGPLLACAVLGAIIGDGLSYWLGFRYQRQVLMRWPFSRHPRLAARSDEFFRKHGGKSVFLGRFTPGLRAFVPLFAGILRMPGRRFYVSNILSAMVWAPAYVLPGVILGASLTLAGSVAGRLAGLVLVVFGLLWACTWLLRYFMRRGMPVLAAALGRLRSWARAQDNWIGRQLLSLLDPARPEAKALALLAAALTAAVWAFLGILEGLISDEPLVRADAAVYGLLQSLRTPVGDAVMITVTELGDSIVIIAVTVAVGLWLAWQRAWRTAAYWVAAVGLASVFNTGIKIALNRSRPIDDLYSGWSAFSFPSGHTTSSVVTFGFLAFLLARELRQAWRTLAIAAATVLVVLIPLSRLYLGAHWLSDVAGGMAFGTAWITLLAIAYLHHRPQAIRARGLAVVAVAALAAAGGFNIHMRNAADKERYAVREVTQVVAAADWLLEDWQQLPAHRIDLIGDVKEPFTVQWAGDPAELQDRLLRRGWRRPEPWTAASTLSWLTPAPDASRLPVVPLLHDGRIPGFTLIQPQSTDSRLVLRLWSTPVEVSDEGPASMRLWLGTVVTERIQRPLAAVTIAAVQPDANLPRTVLASALSVARVVDRPSSFVTAFWDGQVLLLR